MTASPGAGVTVREGGPLEVSVVAALQADAFADGAAGEVWSEAAIARILALPGAFALIAVDGAPRAYGSPVGFVLARLAAEECEILSLGVARARRRRGTGRALLAALAERARSLGADRLHLEVAEDNRPARALYEAAGFAVTGRRPRYYRRGTARAADAVLYSRALVARAAGSRPEA